MGVAGWMGGWVVRGGERGGGECGGRQVPVASIITLSSVRDWDVTGFIYCLEYRTWHAREYGVSTVVFLDTSAALSLLQAPAPALG